MPLYDYECECGKKREVLFRTQGAADNEPVIVCECGKVMRRDFPLYGMAHVDGRARVFQSAISQPWRHKR